MSQELPTNPVCIIPTEPVILRERGVYGRVTHLDERFITIRLMGNRRRYKIQRRYINELGTACLVVGKHGRLTVLMHFDRINEA